MKLLQMNPDQLIAMNDITFLRMVIAEYGRAAYEQMRDKHYRALQMLAQGRNYDIQKVPADERNVFIKHCLWYGRVTADEYVLLLSNDYICRRDEYGRLNYPDYAA